MPEVKSLAELAARALSKEDRERVRPHVRYLPLDVQRGFLAVANHQFRNFTRLWILLRNAVMAIPTYMRGIPRAEWHRFFFATANTTTADYHSRLYQNAEYRFTPRGTGWLSAGNIFSTPFRLMDMTLDPFTGTEVDAILRKDPEHFTRQWNRDRERDFKIDSFKRIRFHSP